MIAASAVSVLFCLIIVSLFLPFVVSPRTAPTLLRELSNFEVARGLITFLVAVTTVGIGIILIVYVVVADDQFIKDKFSLGKEVFTALVGVLGTIIGFYFGATNLSVSGGAPPFKVVSVTIDPKLPRPGSKAAISVKTSGGKGPFMYSLAFLPDKVLGDCDKCAGSSTDGSFTANVSVPATASKSAEIDLLFAIKDSAGAVADVPSTTLTKLTLDSAAQDASKDAPGTPSK
jgi:hypothetical protein